MPSDARGRNGERRKGNVLGSFIRAQRQMANLSLRQLSALAQVSNPYLSQVERGLSEPSVRVLKAIAEALNVSAEAMLEQAGLVDPPKEPDDDASEQALRADRRLTESQKRALLTVYRSYIEANGYGAEPHRGPRRIPPQKNPLQKNPLQKNPLQINGS